MLEKFLKKSSWTDIVISLIFILFGALLIKNPDIILSMISTILGAIFILIGVFKIIDYFSTGKQDNYLITMGILGILTGIIIIFCYGIILSIFRIILGIWIIYSGILNLQTTIDWKEFKSRLWLISCILSVVMIIGGIYVLVNSGAILQTVGAIIVVYGILNIIENVIFIKKVDNYDK